MTKKIGQIEILVAEDSPTQAEQLQLLLEEHGYKVVTAADGKAALTRMGRHPPMLVISDIMMPELDGYGLCKAIKSDDKLKHIPVMLVTTLSDPQDVIRGLECGADNFIRKPYDEKYLLSRIDYLLMNLELRKGQRMQMALEIDLGGHKHFITAERQQVLDLLISTYEQAIHINDELKQREKELVHSNQVLQGLNRISEGLNSAVSEREVAETVLERALELPGIQAGWISLRDGESGFRIAAARGLPPALSEPGAFEGSCDCRRKLLSGELDSVTNILQCERLAKAKGNTRGLSCHASVPLWLGKGNALGVMNLAGSCDKLFNDEELNVLYGVGNQLAVALERAKLHEHLGKLVEERTAKLSTEITERIRIQEEQARLVAIIEATPDMVATASPDGRVRYCNPAGLRLLGFGANEIDAIRIRETHFGWAAKQVLEEGIPLAIKHGSWSGETVMRRRDGTEVPVSQVIVAHRAADGTLAFLSTIVRDISRLMQAEQAAREALSTLDASDDAAYIFDPDTLLFSYVNEGAVRTLGYQREELLEMTPLAFKPGYDETRFREMLAPMLRGELRTYRYTTLHRHKDGHDIPVEVNFQYVAPEGETPRFIAIARDVTERQQNLRKLESAAAELESANASLERERALLAERVAARTAELTAANEALAQAKAAAEDASRAKSAFLATMSHEIRTPMNGVIGMVDVLAQSSLSGHQADLVGTIRESAGSLLGIIDDILDFSKIEAGRLELEREPVSVADLVEGLCNSLVPVAARKGVDLALFISPDIPERVLSDDVRLRQVLYNLIGNAIKFTAGQPDRRGRVTVRVEVVQAAPLRLAMRIADNGIGMTPETVQGLFTPFTQAEISTTRRFGGTGLGLTICRRLVDLMQGEIAVKSAPGAGSSFTVTLPFEVAAEQPVRRQPDLSGLDCIVLESPDVNADDMRAYLAHAGARVFQAADVAAASEAAARLAAPVVVILEAKHGTGHSTDFESVPNVRRVLISHGRRRRARVEGTDTVTLDGDALRRLALLRAVAVAAGRASPEIIQERAAESRLGDEESPPTIAKARARNRLILVAEDDEINQKVILQQLALLGYAAEIAGNGEEALRLWREGRYALLLTDLHMPEMDGYTLAEAIRREETGRRRMPILALTANALRGESSRAHAAGMDEYLTKPVQLSALRAVLGKWLPPANESTASGAPVEATPARVAAAVDVAVLKGLIGNDEDTVREFLTDYLASARQLAEEMRAALAVGDARHAGAIAHKLKSSSRSVGALALGDLCAELENSGRTGSKTAITQVMQSFETTLAGVETEIARLLARPQIIAGKKKK